MPYIHYPRLRGSYDAAVGQHLISLYGCRVKHKNGRIRRVKSWEIIPTDLVKPVGAWAVSQQMIRAGERSLLQMRIATENVK
jgi:hypothetical protein